MKKVYTKEQYDQAVVQNSAFFGFIGALSVALVWVAVYAGPDFRTISEIRGSHDYKIGHMEGVSETRSKYAGEFTRGWDSATASWKEYAAENGMGEFRVNKVNGKIEFQWK